MKSLFTALILIGCIAPIAAQTGIPQDSSKTLQLVEVKAYGQNRQLKEAGMAVSLITPTQLERYNNMNLLPAVNATPGVRMEERSPGSYRLNIRGSSLRSPFGVRNVKVYWNGIPFTDPGGSTYLNQFSFYNIRSIEIVRGPASSLYGAGTGGALLLSSRPEDFKAGADVQYTGGSYGLFNLNAQVRLGNAERNNIISYTRQSGDGYRDHTEFRRDIASWESNIGISEKQSLQTSVIYGDLYYQTPGGLTQKEFLANPRAARPAAGAFPSADGAQAAIRQQTFLAGITHNYAFSDAFRNTTTIYGAFSQIKNPTFRNYEKRSEPHFGGRSVFTYNKQLNNAALNVLFGGEAQRGFFNTKTFRNKGGRPDSVQTDDDINNWLYSAFLQAELQLKHNWVIQAGVSVNQSSISIQRLSSPNLPEQKRTYSSEWAPRIAISKKLIPQLLIYASVSKGFSPPTSQEVLPSTTEINTRLSAEHGVNYEAGVKSNWLNNSLYVEVNAFHYQLQNAIVQRRDASGADYFENAGSTKQEGIESQVRYNFLPRSAGFISNLQAWGSHTWYFFKYKNFKQVNTDLSGKQLPGVAPHTIAAGIDLNTKPGLYANITWFYSDRTALNDANSEYAASYQLTGFRAGWRKAFTSKISTDLYTGFDNLFNAEYSLGNDINAAGGRYYNTAPGRNFFAGLAIKYSW
ncbi:TonB-dependent receptor [Pseudoflavitalea sp. G-6-1-2]|uniref:TonB-dependent receptor n=1 Tax=Pseudoflavitalea sp. G-6-1-2 TaxID=2728841 RepID=UPI00146DFA30|nr:TonB-dependent receptor [Pseudoflavitalea sp. G-6-1-2]NML19508.1 TonB-dependent receptor [Pseudoflavitalea sp. G-6-1-2]